MENSGSLPSSLSFALSVVQGVSTNAFSIPSSTGQGSVAGGGSSIKFNLPTTGIMDFKTSKMTFSVSTAGKGGRIPTNIESLFSSCRITAGGQTICQANNLYGLIKNINYNTGVEHCDDVLGHPEVLDVVQLDGKLISADDANESYDSGVGLVSRMFAVDMGEIARINPQLVSLDLLPQIQVEFITAPNHVLISAKSSDPRGSTTKSFTIANTGATFTIDRPHFVANCYSLLSSSYAQAVRQRIEDIGYLTLVYPQSLGFTQNWVGNSQFSLAANSVKKLTSVWRLRNHTTQRGGIPIAGRCVGVNTAMGGGNGKDGAGFVVSTSDAISESTNDTAAIDTPVCALGERKYQGAINRMTWPNVKPLGSLETGMATGDLGLFANYNTTTDALDLQWSLNSAQYPQFPMSPADVLVQVNRANDVDKMPDCASFQEFLQNKFVCAVKLDLPKGKYDKPCVSGLSTTSQNAFFGIKSVGSGNDANLFENTILAETDVMWRVGANKQMEIIN